MAKYEIEIKEVKDEPGCFSYLLFFIILAVVIRACAG